MSKIFGGLIPEPPPLKYGPVDIIKEDGATWRCVRYYLTRVLVFIRRSSSGQQRAV